MTLGPVFTLSSLSYTVGANAQVTYVFVVVAFGVSLISYWPMLILVSVIVDAREQERGATPRPRQRRGGGPTDGFAATGGPYIPPSSYRARAIVVY